MVRIGGCIPCDTERAGLLIKSKDQAKRTPDPPEDDPDSDSCSPTSPVATRLRRYASSYWLLYLLHVRISRIDAFSDLPVRFKIPPVVLAVTRVSPSKALRTSLS